ncbi:MAG: NUDIX domain-containing protein [Thermostichales cyanobacterium SZTDM-1c_bins_54]
MRQDTAYGVIVIVTSPEPQYLLIRHRKGHWGFPKGHKEGQESDQAAALRELQEETGLSGLQLLPDICFQERYTFQDPQGIPVQKTNHYFVSLVAPPPPPLQIQLAEVSEAGWFTPPAAATRLTFAEGKDLLQRCQHWFSTFNPDPS